MEQILKGTREDSRWNPLFMLLSMERVEPFFAEMGLDLPNLQAVRECARRLIKEYNDGSGNASWYEALLQRTFECISQTAGEEAAGLLYRWAVIQFPYHSDQYYAAHAWERLLRWLGGIHKGKVLPLALPEDKLVRIKKAVIEQFGDDYRDLRDRIRQVDQQPALGWEEYLYRIYREGGPSDVSPLDILLDAISHYRFTNVWSIVKSILTAGEMQVLLDWGRAQAEQMGSSPPQDLPA